MLACMMDGPATQEHLNVTAPLMGYIQTLPFLTSWAAVLDVHG